jgi:hypothetical protein
MNSDGRCRKIGACRDFRRVAVGVDLEFVIGNASMVDAGVNTGTM